MSCETSNLRRTADGKGRFSVRLVVGVVILLCGCTMAPRPSSRHLEKPVSHLPTIADDEFWSRPTKIRDIEVALANSSTPLRSVFVPSHVDRRKVANIPLYIVQSGPFEEFRHGNFAEEGTVALMDQDRNLLVLEKIPENVDEPETPRPKGPRQPGAAVHSVQTAEMDIASRLFPDLPQVVGRFQIMGILPLTATAPASVHIGADPATFEVDLAQSLGTIPPRKEIPQELLSEPLPWKALAAPPSLPEGLRATLSTESGQYFLEVDFALPELKGERLHLEAGAVLPSGNRPPDAVKWVHVVAAGEDYLQPAKVLLPVVGGGQDKLLRGHAKIDLGRLFSGMATGDFQAAYVFSGSVAIGPLELPARKP